MSAAQFPDGTNVRRSGYGWSIVDIPCDRPRAIAWIGDRSPYCRLSECTAIGVRVRCRSDALHSLAYDWNESLERLGQ